MTNRNDGIFGGNGSWFIVLILFFLAMGGNFFGGNYERGNLTRAELYDGLNIQDIQNSLNGLGVSMNNGFMGVQNSLCAGFGGVQSAIADSNYRMADCCCQIKQAIASDGEQTRALITQNTIQDLRDKVADKDRELLATGLVTAQTLQTNNIENFIRTMFNGCGCGC